MVLSSVFCVLGLDALRPHEITQHQFQSDRIRWGSRAFEVGNVADADEALHGHSLFREVLEQGVKTGVPGNDVK